MGSNIDPEVYLPRAAGALLEIGAYIRSSNVYQNPAIADSSQPDYLNAAVLLETGFEPFEIRARLRNIENRLGRVRTEDKYAPRTIDLDLCLLDDLILETDELSLPDPDLLSRPHLAVTISELDPEFIHPLTGEKLGDIAVRLKENAELTRRDDVHLQVRE